MLAAGTLVMLNREVAYAPEHGLLWVVVDWDEWVAFWEARVSVPAERDPSSLTYLKSIATGQMHKFHRERFVVCEGELTC